MGEAGGELQIGLNEIQVSPQDSKSLGIRAGKAVCLSVADTGSGIPQDLIKKIFDPFFTTKEEGEGTGMGLSVVHGIVKAMNGGINVYSEPDAGAEFKIYIPVAGQKNIQSEKAAFEKTNFHIGTEQILLVDDEEAILTLEKQALEKLGYRVDPESCPVEALKTFHNAPEKYDLIITDMSMPRMSGEQFTSEELGIRPDIPVIVCTGFSRKITPDKIREMGIRDVLMKPVLIQELSEKIRSILDNPAAQDKS